MFGVDFNGAEIYGFREGEEGQDEGKGDQSDCYVVDHSPWMVDCNKTIKVSITFKSMEEFLTPQ